MLPSCFRFLWSQKYDRQPPQSFRYTFYYDIIEKTKIKYFTKRYKKKVRVFVRKIIKGIWRIQHTPFLNIVVKQAYCEKGCLKTLFFKMLCTSSKHFIFVNFQQNVNNNSIVKKRVACPQTSGEKTLQFYFIFLKK